MKKLFTILGLMFVLPFITSASTFVITPAGGSYNTGDSITLNISVNPSGSTIYTAMLDAKFSPDTLEVVSFTLNDSMLAMKQAGYDSINNTGGILIKTGGFAGGISSLTSFGTLILKAKGSGAGTFTINSTSKLLDSSNTNKQVGSQIASYTIANIIPVVVPIVDVKPTPNINSNTVIPEKKPGTIKVVTSTTTTATTAATSLSATVGQSKAAGNMILLILALITSFIIGYFFGNRKIIRKFKL
jgi:hypothetical protein